MYSLYKLSNEIEILEQKLDQLEIEPNDGEGWVNLQTAICDELMLLEQDGNRMIVSCIEWIKSLKSVISARKTEIEALKKRQQTDENKISAIKKFMKMFFDQTQTTRFKHTTGTAFILKGREKVLVDTTQLENWSPEEYDIAVDAGAIVEEVRVLTTKLKEALPDSWDKLAGVFVEAGEDTVVVR